MNVIGDDHAPIGFACVQKGYIQRNCKVFDEDRRKSEVEEASVGENEEMGKTGEKNSEKGKEMQQKMENREKQKRHPTKRKEKLGKIKMELKKKIYWNKQTHHDTKKSGSKEMGENNEVTRIINQN